jgi:hypothetical protein
VGILITKNYATVNVPHAVQTPIAQYGDAHEALCLDGLCNAPLASELGALPGAQLAAANIAVPSVTVTLDGSGSDSVTITGTASRIKCGGNCSALTATSATILTAKPGSNLVFAG